MHEPGHPELELGSLCATLNRCLLPRLGAALFVGAEWPIESATAQPVPGLGVTLRLALGASAAAPELSVWLDTALATNLVDRALGGPGQIGVATRAAYVSDAECGVLAYLAARVAQALPPLGVRDVSTGSGPLAPWLWSLRVQLGEAVGSVHVGLHEEHTSARLPCAIALHDSLSDADADAIKQGDLLTLDQTPLSLTTQGLSIPCFLLSPELDAVLPVTLDAGQLRGRGAPVARRARASDAWLLLHETNLTIQELASLARGQALPCAVDPAATFTLMHREVRRARGVLVRERGKLAFEVTDGP